MEVDKLRDLMIFSGTGFIIFIVGVLLLKREIKLFNNAVTTKATVATYHEASNSLHHNITMYTMVAEYMLMDGTIIQAEETSESNRRKYQIGAEIEIRYRGMSSNGTKNRNKPSK
jgi:hypothetical protein